MLMCDRQATKQYRDPESGKAFFSVSQVLNCLDPERFKTVQKDVLDRACARGTQVHAQWARILAARAGLGTFTLDTVPPALRGYARAIATWAEEREVYPLQIEDPSWSSHGFAGTPDGKVRYGRERRIIIPELKSGIEERLNRVQVQAYWRLKGYEDAQGLLLLYVNTEGQYTEKWVTPSPHDWSWFLAGVGVLVGRVNNF